MAGVSKPTSNYGGYDYKFVKKVRDDFICHICRLVFRDPHLTGCCGQRFCQSLSRAFDPCVQQEEMPSLPSRGGGLLPPA